MLASHYSPEIVKLVQGEGEEDEKLVDEPIESRIIQPPRHSYTCDKSIQRQLAIVMVSFVIIFGSAILYNYYSDTGDHNHESLSGYTSICFSHNEPYDNAQKLEDFLKLNININHSCISMLDLGKFIFHIALRDMDVNDTFYHILEPNIMDYEASYGQDRVYFDPHSKIFKVDVRYPHFSSDKFSPVQYPREKQRRPEQSHDSDEVRECERYNAIVVEYEELVNPRQSSRKTHTFIGYHAQCIQHYVDRMTKVDRCKS